MRSLALETSAVLLALALPCEACSSGSSRSAPADASADTAAMTLPETGTDTGIVIPPPSDDCRYVDDEGITCDGTYYLANAQLYVCGDLTTTDGTDAGIYRPYPPPPLPASVDCRNVAPPATTTGGTQQLGALWCCLGQPVCVRAAAIDSACSGGKVGLSCPTAQPVFPAGANDGGACVPPGTPPDGGDDDGGEAPDTGLTLTPPQRASETLWCCPP